MDAAEPSGARQTAKGSPKGECGGANQYKHVALANGSMSSNQSLFT